MDEAVTGISQYPVSFDYTSRSFSRALTACEGHAFNLNVALEEGRDAAGEALEMRSELGCRSDMMRNLLVKQITPRCLKVLFWSSCVTETFFSFFFLHQSFYPSTEYAIPCFCTGSKVENHASKCISVELNQLRRECVAAEWGSVHE